MKKHLLIIIGCLLASQASFGKPCAINVNQLQVAGIQIGQTTAAFFAEHPTAKQVILPIDNYQIELPDNTDDKLKADGVTGVGHIGFNPKTQRISSFSLSFLDGGLATYETDLTVFKNRIIKKFNLPKSGWKQTKGTAFEYQCTDYNIAIIQDHGAVHTAVGPTVMIFSRYMDNWQQWKKS